MAQETICKIGLIADVQYADVEDGTNFARTIKRYYRAALDHLSQAVDTWISDPAPLDCVLQLGDVLDGRSKKAGKAEQDLATVVAEFERLPCPTYHIVGNHELYNFTKEEILQSELFARNRDAKTMMTSSTITTEMKATRKKTTKPAFEPEPSTTAQISTSAISTKNRNSADNITTTGTMTPNQLKPSIQNQAESLPQPKSNAQSLAESKPQPEPQNPHNPQNLLSKDTPQPQPQPQPQFSTKAYFHTSPAPGVRIVCLDPYDVAMIGHAPADANAANNAAPPSYLQARAWLRRHNPNADANDTAGLWGYDRRFAAFNGAIGAQQLAWLEEVLSGADRAGEVVIMAGHIPLILEASDEVCLIWNNEEILQLLAQHPCVAIYLAGHTHCEAYGMDDAGIHHLTLPGVVEVPPGERNNGFGTLAVFADRLELTGYGGFLGSRVMMLHRKADGTGAKKLKNCSVV